MARKIIDTYPVITLTIGSPGPAYEARSMTLEEAREALRDALDSINTVFKRDLGRTFDVDHKLAVEAVCEHCRWRWTEDSADYNGGCCGKDEANSPERLKEFRELADAVDAETFYRVEDGERSTVPIDWPGALAHGVVAWLDNGRSSEQDGIDFMLRLAKRVKASEWCTVWEDPGPSGCSLARMPDRVQMDIRPEQLADELCSLLDDMGLLPARQAVA